MRITIPLLLLSGLSLSAHGADTIDYSYFDAALVSHDGPRNDFEGLGVRLSLPINAQLYGKAEFSTTEAGGVDRSDFAFGGGYHMPLSRRTDFFAEVEIASVDTDAGDDDGFRFGGGVRSLLAKELEVRGAIRYVDLGDGELLLDIGAQYLINPAWAAFIDVTEGDDFGGYRLGARYNF